MKYIIFLLGFIPTILFAQERQQKLNFRTPPSRSFSTPSPSYDQPRQPQVNRNYEQYQKQNFRREREENRFHGGGRNNYYFYDPYWDLGWNRWYGWGAPRWGWNYWEPYWYYDNWGYRQPARVYVYKDGRSDTIKGQKTKFNLGVQKIQDQIGGFFAVGNNIYFIAEYSHSYKRDESSYYTNITMEDVMRWQDTKLSDINKLGSFYAGLGKRLGRLGLHTEVGYNSETVRYQYFDELFLLSNNGLYSFPKYNSNYLSLKVGGLYDYKFSTFKLDYDITRNVISVGGGFNF